jgi:RNA binding exosome subunit
MADFDEVAVDESKVSRAIRMELPLIMTTYTLPHKVERYIERVVGIFLDHTKQSRLRDNIVYCLQELVVNAKKANTKRVYFFEKGLDLNNENDYREGMATFKDETLANINYYLELQRQQGLYIKLILHLKDNVINIEVRNNSMITASELERIRGRIIQARQYNDVEEAMMELLDDTEGAGLGLVILVLMMKKLGLGDESFDILRTNAETIARIVIPRNLKKAS